MTTHRFHSVLWAAAALLLTGTAHAQSAGTLTGRWPARAGMPHAVGESFLHHAVQREVERFAQAFQPATR